MRILFFHDRGEIYPKQAGGKERCIINLARKFSEKGNQIKILTLSANIRKETIYKGIKIKLIKDYSIMREIIKSLEQNDIFSYHSSNFLMPSVSNSRAFRIYHVHDIFMGLKNKGRHLDKVISFNWDKIYSPSEFVTETIKNVYWWCDVGSKIETIPRGIDLKIFFPRSKELSFSRLSKKIGINEINKIKSGKPIILFPNRMDSKKGENLLFGLIKKLKERFPKLRVILFHSQDKQKSEILEKLIVKYPESIVLLDWQDEKNLSYLYSLVDITLIPTFNPEAFCQTALESVACGTPVICTKFGNLRNLSKEIPLIKLSDPEANNFLNLIKNLTLKKISKNKIRESLEIIRKRYNLEEVVSLYLSSFSKLKKEKENKYFNFNEERYIFSPFAYLSGDVVYVAELDDFKKYTLSKTEKKVITLLGNGCRNIADLKGDEDIKIFNIERLIKKKIIWKV